MKFELINGVLVRSDESVVPFRNQEINHSHEPTTYTWKMPQTTFSNSPTLLQKSSKPLLEANHPNIFDKKKDFKVSSSVIASFTAIPLMAVGTASDGVFWETFLKYIFPWMIDIAKVFCAIKIAQAFYEENRGGKQSGTGTSAFVTYGKWYLLFWMIPWGVELIDQIGGKMFNDLTNP